MYLHLDSSANRYIVQSDVVYPRLKLKEVADHVGPVQRPIQTRAAKPGKPLRAIYQPSLIRGNRRAASETPMLVPREIRVHVASR